MSEVKRYSLALMEAEPLFEDEEGHLVLFSAYEDLAEKYEEGLQREAELRAKIDKYEGDGSWGEMASTVKLDILQQRLSEAQEILAKAIYLQWYDEPGYVPWVDGSDSLRQWEAREEAMDQLRGGGCADEENTE